MLARGALVCPSCSLPISPAPRVRPQQTLSCGFCSHAAPALDFLAREVRDTLANEVILVARMA